MMIHLHVGSRGLHFPKDKIIFLGPLEVKEIKILSGGSYDLTNNVILLTACKISHRLFQKDEEVIWPMAMLTGIRNGMTVSSPIH